MTRSRRHQVAFGASFIVMGASVVLLTALATFLSPQSSRAVDSTPAPTPVGIEVIVPVIVVPPPPVVGGIVPVGVPAATAQVEITGSGLGPYAYYEITVRSTPVVVASGFADGTGSFKVTVNLPANLDIGNHSVEIKSTDAAGKPYAKTVSQFVVTADRHIAGAGPGSSLTTPTASPTNTTNPTSNSSTQMTQTDPAKAAAALGDQPVDVGGVLFVSGVVAATQPNFSPLGGTALLSFTVKNASHTTFDSSLAFWVTSPLGDTVSQLENISVAGLAPGETRTVDATLIHLSEWPMVFAHATITPPASVEKTTLSPLTRDATVLTLPLFALIMAALFAAGYFLWRYLPVLTPAGRAARRNEPATASPQTVTVYPQTVTVEPVVVVPPVVEPVFVEPVLVEPASAEPATAEPASAEPATAEPASAEPATAEPASAEPEPLEVPATVIPIVTKPVAQKPVAKKPVAKTPAADKSVATKPPAGDPASTTSAKAPAAKTPAPRKPRAPRAAPVVPTDDTPVVDKPSVSKPLADKPSVSKPLADKPAARKPRVAQPKPQPKPQPENTEGGDE